MNAVAEVPQVTVTVPASNGFVNPLTIEATADRVDDLVTRMIDSAVGTVEDEIQRMIRRREVASAVRGVRRVKTELDRTRQDAMGVPGMGTLLVGGHRTELLAMFGVLNPAANAADVETVVDAFLGQYEEDASPEPKKRKGKSSGD